MSISPENYGYRKRKFHGHIRTWNRSNGNQGLTQAMKNALYDAGYIKSSKGTSFKLTDYVKELIGKFRLKNR